MILFGILLGIDVIVALVVLYFFFIGLADGSVSSFNMLLWMALPGIVVAVPVLGWALNANGYRGRANGVLSVLAIPGFLFGLFILAAVVLQPNWH